MKILSKNFFFNDSWHNFPQKIIKSQKKEEKKNNERL